VKGVTDLMVRPGIINLDFADVRSVMNEMGKAMMGTGEASAEDRAVQAAEKAIANPLLDEISLKGARGVLINVTAGPDLTLFELDEAANRIRAEVDPEANIMVGSTLDPEMAGMMRVSVVATGIDAAARPAQAPMPQRTVSEPVAAAAPQPQQQVRIQEPVFAAPPVAQAPVEPAAPSFADAQFADLDRAPVLNAEWAEEPVPQPGGIQRTAPYGQPKIQAEASGAPRPGDPTPDALRRLQAAVQNVPKAQPMVRSLQQPQPAARAESAGRLTINSLIHKMTGHAAREGNSALSRAADPALEAHSHESPDAEFESNERERVDIPAFLRRQAN
jgi:cell division protein FtsZ